MNNRFLIVAIAVVAVLVVMLGVVIFNFYPVQKGAASSIAYTSSDNIKTDKPLLNVSGEGKVLTRPDRAIINMGVQTENKDAKIAQTENAQKMDAVMKKLQELGIAKDDIKTSVYNISPQYDYSDGKSYLKGYQVLNILAVTIKDTAKVGDIIDQVVQVGANRIDSVAFTISEPDKYYNEAIAKAIDQAKEKANVMANAGGVKIKGVFNISEVNAGYQPVYDYNIKGASMAAADLAVPTPISSGQLEVKANVTVAFEIQ